MKIFYLTFAISLLLIIGGFLLPPMGIIDGSVLTAVGELLMFGVLAQLPAITTPLFFKVLFTFTRRCPSPLCKFLI